MVLPTPEGPRSRMLSPASRKPRPRSCSMRGRLILRGWVQQKRSMGLTEPREAALVRRARLEASRARRSRVRSCSRVSVGPRRLLCAWARKALRGSRAARKPRDCRESTRSCGSSGFIVGLQVMGDDVAVDDVVGEREVQGDGVARLAPKAIAGDGEGTWVVQTALDQFGDGASEQGLAVQVQQLDGAGDADGEAALVGGPALQQGGEVGGCGAQAVAALELAGRPTLVQQFLAMGWVLPEAASSEGAGVAGDLGLSIEQAYDLVIGDQGQGAVPKGARDRVAIGVEADEGLRIDGYRHDQVGWGQRVWEREQAGLLLLQHVPHRAGGEGGMQARVCDLGDEGPKGRIALLYTDDRAGRQKPVPQVADGALDLALVLGAPHGAQTRLDMEGPAQLQQDRMEADGFAAALEHDDLGVVEEPLAGDPTEGPGGAQKGPGQRVHRQVDDKLPPQGARVAEHHHEQPQGALGAIDGDLAHVGPVNLGLLAQQGLGAQIDLAARARTDGGDIVPQRADRARKAARLQHVV